MEPSLSRRERKKLATRQRLMQAALQLFSEHGYDATTVEEIAEAADVAKSTFFNYFETKEAIVPALMEWRLTHLEDTISATSTAPVSSVERIKRLLHLVIDDPLANPALARQLFMVQRGQQNMQPIFALTALISEQVRQAQQAGEIRDDVNPTDIGSIIRAVFLHQVVNWHCGDKQLPLSATIDRMINILMEGIAGPNWRPSP